jgi:hypothetical protein
MTDLTKDGEVSVSGGYLTRSMRHTQDCVGSGSAAYEAWGENLLCGRPSVSDVGVLAAR